jgi:hypothetical protein
MVEHSVGARRAPNGEQVPADDRSGASSGQPAAAAAAAAAAGAAAASDAAAEKILAQVVSRGMELGEGLEVMASLHGLAGGGAEEEVERGARRGRRGTPGVRAVASLRLRLQWA